jgi:hypothetical protein
MRLPILPEALDELDSEMVHLEISREGWGRKLLEEVAEVAKLAAERPRLGERDEEAPEEFEVRRFPIKRFHCVVIIALIDGERSIIAVAPGRKEPGYWLDRLE